MPEISTEELLAEERTVTTEELFGNNDIPPLNPDEAGQIASDAYTKAADEKLSFGAAHQELLDKSNKEFVDARETIKQYTSFPGKMQFAAFGKGATLATAGLMTTLGDMADGLNDLASNMGLPEAKKAVFFRDIAATATKSSEYWENVLQKEGASGVDRIIGGSLGALGPGASEWALGVPFAAGAGAAEAHKEGKPVLQGAAIEGAKRYVLGKLLDYYAIIKNPAVRRTLGATTLGAATGLEGGSPEDIASQAVMGAVFANKAKGLAIPAGSTKFKGITIKSPAVQTAEGKIYEAQTHAQLDNILGKEGFTTSEGRFVDRIKAAEIAKESGQIKESVEAKKLQRESVITAMPGGRAKEVWEMTKGEFEANKMAWAEFDKLHSAGEIPKEWRDEKGKLKSEYIKYLPPPEIKYGVDKGYEYSDYHKISVEMAHSRGEKVPMEVLSEYGLEPKKGLENITSEHEPIKLEKQESGQIKKGTIQEIAELTDTNLITPADTSPIGDKSIPEHLKATAAKTMEEIGKAEVPRQEIETEKTQELGRRVAISSRMAEGAEGEARLSAALRPLAGKLTEYKRTDFKPLRETLSQQEVDAMHNDIWQRPHSEEHFDKINTAKAWSKVVEGYVPTRGEILLLEKQWGPDFARKLLAKRPFAEKLWDFAAELSGFMRTVVAGGDISVAGRQLRLLGQRYIPEYGKAATAGVKSYGAELAGHTEVAKNIRSQYESSAYHKEAKKSGIEFFEPAGTVSVSPYERPEWYVSQSPEKLPVIGKMIRAGNVNYIETTNMFLQAIWDKMRTADVANGFKPTRADLQKRAKWLMDMSGRTPIRSEVGHRVAPVLSGLFFAPRFSISRFTTPTYLKDLASGDPVARAIAKDTATSFASFAGTNVAVLSLMKLAFGDEFEVEINPLSAGFGKGRIGNTRFDLWAGYEQASRFLLQMATGMYQTAGGKIKDRPRLDTLVTFLRSKESPVVALMADLYTGKTFTGNKPELGSEAYQRLTFMFVQDFIDAAQNDGLITGIASGIASGSGVGIQSYPDTAYTKQIVRQDEIAQAAHGKNWEDLSPKQQSKLLRTNKVEVNKLQTESKRERASRGEYEFVAKLIEDEKEAGKEVTKTLPSQIQKEMDSLGISIGLSRKSGKFVMNDETYKKYQELTSELLRPRLEKLTSRPSWLNASDKSKQTKLTDTINMIKEQSRRKVIREVNKQASK